MPITKARLDRMIDMIDSAWLKRRDSEGRERDITNPLEAPPQAPFSDSPPEKIHGKPDQELWPPKPRVPVPIEHL